MHIGILFITIACSGVVHSAPKPYFSRTFVQTPTSSFGQYVIVPEKNNAYRVPLSQVHHYSDFQFPKQQVVYFGPSDEINQHALHTLQKDNPVWQEMMLNLHEKSTVNSVLDEAGSEGLEKLKRENSESSEESSGSEIVMEPITTSSEEYDSLESDKSEENLMAKKLNATEIMDSAENTEQKSEENLIEEPKNLTTESQLAQILLVNETDSKSIDQATSERIPSVDERSAVSDVVYANDKYTDIPVENGPSDLVPMSKIADLISNLGTVKMSSSTGPVTEKSFSEIVTKSSEIPQETQSTTQAPREMIIELVQNANNETEIQLKLVDLTTESLKELEDNLRSVSDNSRIETPKTDENSTTEPRKNENSILIEQAKVDQILSMLEEMRARDTQIKEIPQIMEIKDVESNNFIDSFRMDSATMESVLLTESTASSTESTSSTDFMTSTSEEIESRRSEMIRSDADLVNSRINSTESPIEQIESTYSSIQDEASQNQMGREFAKDLNVIQTSTGLPPEEMMTITEKSSTELLKAIETTEQTKNNEIISSEDPALEISTQTIRESQSEVQRDELMARLLDMLKEMLATRTTTEKITETPKIDELSTSTALPIESSSENFVDRVEYKDILAEYPHIDSLARNFDTETDSNEQVEEEGSKIEENNRTAAKNINLDSVDLKNFENLSEEQSNNTNMQEGSQENGINENTTLMDDAALAANRTSETDVKETEESIKILMETIQSTTESMQTLTESPQNLNLTQSLPTQQFTESTESSTAFNQTMTDDKLSIQQRLLEPSTSTQENQFEMQQTTQNSQSDPRKNTSESTANNETTEAIKMSSIESTQLVENIELSTNEAVDDENNENLIGDIRVLNVVDGESGNENSENQSEALLKNNRQAEISEEDSQQPIEESQKFTENLQISEPNLKFGDRIVKTQTVQNLKIDEIAQNIESRQQNSELNEEIQTAINTQQNEQTEQSTIKSEQQQQNENIREGRINKTPTMFLHNNKFYVISGAPEFYANFDAYQNPRTPIFSLQELQPIRPTSNVAVQKIEPFRIYVNEKSSTQNDNEPLSMQNSSKDNPPSDIENEKSMNVEQQRKLTVKVKKGEQVRMPVSQAKRDLDYEEESEIAQANPEALSIAGPRGRSSAGPRATAVTGRKGFSQASPEATAIAGRAKIQESEEVDYDDLNDDIISRRRRRGNILQRIINRNRLNRRI